MSFFDIKTIDPRSKNPSHPNIPEMVWRPPDHQNTNFVTSKSWFQPKKGKILVDNSDLSLLNPDDWRKKIGYVTQDHYFFNDSVYNNLCLGDNHYNDEEIKKILEVSLCDDFLDLNIDLRKIKMGESGLKFSVGKNNDFQ